MSEIVLNAQIRTTTGRHARQSRKTGHVPGVYYARGEGNLNIQVLRSNLDPLIYTSKTHIIDLKLQDGTSKRCILRDVQFDPVTDLPIHFDLQGLRENEKLVVEVPVVLAGGTPLGVRDGGMLQLMIHKVRVSCLPKDIPEKIELDVSSLGMNHFIHVRDLSLANVTIIENLDNPIVGVVPPTLHKEAEPAAAAEEEVKEPEVVGKGKKAEEGEEGAAEAPAKPEGKAAAKAEAKEEKK